MNSPCLFHQISPFEFSCYIIFHLFLLPSTFQFTYHPTNYPSLRSPTSSLVFFCLFFSSALLHLFALGQFNYLIEPSYSICFYSLWDPSLLVILYLHTSSPFPFFFFLLFYSFKYPPSNLPFPVAISFYSALNFCMLQIPDLPLFFFLRKFPSTPSEQDCSQVL